MNKLSWPNIEKILKEESGETCSVYELGEKLDLEGTEVNDLREVLNTFKKQGRVGLATGKSKNGVLGVMVFIPKPMETKRDRVSRDD